MTKATTTSSPKSSSLVGMASRKQSPASPRAGTGPRTDWGEVSGWYDQLVGDSGSEFHREVVLPGALRLLALKPGQSAIDIACGQGVLCRKLHQMGVEATGIDAAEELIRDRKSTRLNSSHL